MKRLRPSTLALALVFLSVSLASACGGDGESRETTFTLQNDTDETIYVQDYEWFRLRADGELVSPSSGGLCLPQCGRLFNEPVSCAGARLAIVIELAPGESIQRDWDGTYYELDEQRECYRERRRMKGVEVEYCWGDTFEDDGFESMSEEEGVYHGAWIDEPTCESSSFQVGTDVSLSVQ